MVATSSVIPEVRITRTSVTRAVAMTLQSIVSAGQIATILGPVGVGKATAIKSALETQLAPTVWINVPAVYSPKEVIQDIYAAACGDVGNWSLRDLQNDLVQALSEQPRTLVFNNAERLTKELAGQIEWLQQRMPGTSIVLAGLPTTEMCIAREPHLQARIAERIDVQPMSVEELLTVLPGIHDLFFSADRALLSKIDSTVCHGNLGTWMRFLQRALSLRKQAADAGQDIPPLDPRLAKAVIERMPQFHTRRARR